MQATLNIVRRTTDERVFMMLLEQLSECRLHEGRSGTYQRHDPHPEHGTWSAYGNGCSYAGQVPCSYS